MKFTVELNVGEAPDPEAVSQFLAWGARLDTGGAQLMIGEPLKQAAFEPEPEAEVEAEDKPESAAVATEGKRRPGRPRKVHPAPLAEPEPVPPTETAPPAPPPPPSAPPAGMALPPGIAMPGAAAPQVAAAVPSAPQATAMPQVPPAAAPEGGGVPLEVFREAYRQSHTAKPGAAFVLFKAQAWPDGTPKGTWFTAESVPPDQRERMMLEMSML